MYDLAESDADIKGIVIIILRDHVDERCREKYYTDHTSPADQDLS
jgi:hypothetical protein